MGFYHQIGWAFRLKLSHHPILWSDQLVDCPQSAHRFTPRLRQRQRRRQQVACARGGSWRCDSVTGVEKDGLKWWFNGVPSGKLT
jgi:hypothetical protein